MVIHASDSSSDNCAALATSVGVLAQNKSTKKRVTQYQVYVEKFKKIAPSLQKQAAKETAKRGLKPGIAGKGGIGMLATQAPDPGGVPHYFGPYANWAFSPLPKGPVATVTVVDGGTGYSATPTVTVDDAYLPTGAFTPATVSVTVVGGVLTGFTIVNGGAGHEAPVINITDATGASALGDAIIGGPLTGGNSYRYRVAAYNAGGTSAFVTLGTAVVIQTIPAVPATFTVAVVWSSGSNDAATLTWTMVPNVNPANFTIQRANNLDFTTGLTTFAPAGTARSLTQNVNRNTVYYHRIRANNNVGDSSAWKNALPFPILTP
jgi:hypothetical protein